ncbi:MAG: hypothetical protein HF312_17220 [Ignavibacteria bacterium]|jgi:hypothetical protein|nr:hypothetical protein [Ignavibacteria bacterium]
MNNSPEYQEALAEYHQALQNFSYAAPEFLDIAILLLSAAEIKLDMAAHTDSRGRIRYEI